ncbi:hypothetical protein L1987_01117 [Smallanthus sonchifolius]|uniref:Uncharacterized protein n=1 Tax=Smallanthus sonchifolius TaxID=185202 RepID=A0ACB9K413_9ASTR|nr:hypothetical protein L1987_01117 [Smallanthus sonchifolius]
MGPDCSFGSVILELGKAVVETHHVKQATEEPTYPSFPKENGDHSLRDSPILPPKNCWEGSRKASLTMDSDEEPLSDSDDLLSLSAEEKKQIFVPRWGLLVVQCLTIPPLLVTSCIMLSLTRIIFTIVPLDSRVRVIVTVYPSVMDLEKALEVAKGESEGYATKLAAQQADCDR